MQSQQVKQRLKELKLSESLPIYDSPFITLNFRGTKFTCRKDIFEYIPYLNALFTNSCIQNNSVDVDGNPIISENGDIVFKLIDSYRCWLQNDKPEFMERMSKRGLVASVGKRLGFENDFLKALMTCTNPNPTKNIYVCYYCNNVFDKKEILATYQKVCKYHSDDCVCNGHNRPGCARVPFHSPVPIDIAKKKKAQ